MPKLAIIAKPNAKKSGITRQVLTSGRSSETMTLEVALAAPPVDGRANVELVRTLAKALGLKKKDVALISGETGRNKLVEISGISRDELHARIVLVTTPSKT